MSYVVEQTTAFSAWLDGLADPVGKRAISIRLVRVSAGLLGDHKSLGDGISELRVDVGPGYRLYYTMRDRTLIFMLRGGDKSTQHKDMKAAKTAARALPG